MLLLNVAADGTCEMTEEDAESFLRAGWVRSIPATCRARNEGSSRFGRAQSKKRRNPTRSFAGIFVFE